jgi:purine-binding chemotaxis protein CheW
MADSQPVAIQAVVFRLGAEFFALPVTMVREILDYRDAFHMPGAPAWLMGLTDVRGASVPMVDLRRRLGMPSVEVDATTRVLVVEAAGMGRAGGVLVLGLVVDKVCDVCGFAGNAREEIPDIGTRWQADYIRAVMRRDDGFVLLLDIAGILADADLIPLDTAA